ncbi:MAG TPA: hypothetical protein PLA16_10790 [Chitinophagales bacterium]|nr:hypothetical protein [Chitinophagales bacterium]HQD13113.1 hypothetical protein [Chitinophagales bacterium]HQO31574.1 hypothetical protein [Chitinophagales bacterium]HQO88918.1 hypothetical protein [Chitinophagales bacterium]
MSGGGICNCFSRPLLIILLEFPNALFEIEQKHEKSDQNHCKHSNDSIQLITFHQLTRYIRRLRT